MKLYKKVLLVEDEKSVRDAFKATLELDGFSVLEAGNPKQALLHIQSGWTGVIVSDIRMPEMDGMEFLEKMQKFSPEIPVVLVTGHGDVALAIKAIRSGAYDFMEKPVSPELMLDVIYRACQTYSLVVENKLLRQQLDNSSNLDGKLIGKHPTMVSLKKRIETLAGADIDVLITGETGTGKELVARSLHEFSNRKEAPFVALNCGALPETVIESELFGHESGSFTGAEKQRVGKLEYCNGGTLFLDEIESMPLHMQIKLLRVLQERMVERLGGNTSIPIDIRVIAATKIDLLEASEKGTFRLDFYYRLNVAAIEIPPLRDRLSDIPLLFTHFVEVEAQRLKKDSPLILQEHLKQLQSRDWKGNVRELRNVAERFVMGISELLQCDEHFESDNQELMLSDEGGLDSMVSNYERNLIESALLKYDGKVMETAEYLSIPRKKLYLRMKKYGIKK